jgi:hypothetical protein
MGKVACELTTGASLLSTRVCTCWPTEKFGRVWVTYSPDQALYNANLYVDIMAVIQAAAMAAQLDPKPNPKIPKFDWEPFMKKSLARKNKLQ